MREHSASRELQGIAEQYDADVLCLQECDSSDMPERIGHLRLIDQTKANRLGLAMYCRADRFTVHRTKVFALRKSLHDRVMAPAHERLLAAHLTDLETEQGVLVGDFNYPWFVRGLERHLSTAGYQLTRTNAPTYVRYRYFSGYFDFVTSTGFQIDDIDVLPQGASDHLPISLVARIAA